MTINIALATSEAVILGCDSLSSTTDYLLSQWDFIERGADGAPVLDESFAPTSGSKSSKRFAISFQRNSSILFECLLATPSMNTAEFGIYRSLADAGGHSNIGFVPVARPLLRRNRRRRDSGGRVPCPGDEQGRRTCSAEHNCLSGLPPTRDQLEIPQTRLED
ncbi:hypothetical protein [Burkholderia diffusa]|uniref:hypothetical protein n=1 Tax=Burkholderia diffusa TaxID=488732 RepID=UPI002AB32322|nr:hypothetical protein [Burkholderia diffusa]